MKYRITIVVLLTVLSLGLVLIFVWTYTPKVNPALVHPSITALEQPLSDLNITWLKDDRSKKIMLIDSGGDRVDIRLSFLMGNPLVCEKMYFGSYKEKLEIDENRYPDTREAILNLIEQNFPRAHKSDWVLPMLSDSFYIRLRVILKVWIGHYDEYFGYPKVPKIE